jgi:transposase
VSELLDEDSVCFFGKGIDSLARLCQDKLAEDPFSGCVFVFRSRGGTAIRLLSYDG